MREETGDFGELVYAGMDWVDPALAKRSMQLMAEQVMPRVNAAIGKSAKKAGENRGGVKVPAISFSIFCVTSRAPAPDRCRPEFR